MKFFFKDLTNRKWTTIIVAIILFFVLLAGLSGSIIVIRFAVWMCANRQPDAFNLNITLADYETLLPAYTYVFVPAFQWSSSEY